MNRWIVLVCLMLCLLLAGSNAVQASCAGGPCPDVLLPPAPIYLPLLGAAPTP